MTVKTAQFLRYTGATLSVVTAALYIVFNDFSATAFGIMIMGYVIGLVVYAFGKVPRWDAKTICTTFITVGLIGAIGMYGAFMIGFVHHFTF